MHGKSIWEAVSWLRVRVLGIGDGGNEGMGSFMIYKCMLCPVEKGSGIYTMSSICWASVIFKVLSFRPNYRPQPSLLRRRRHHRAGAAYPRHDTQTRNARFVTP